MTSSRLRLCLLIALLITSLLPHARPAQAAAAHPSPSAAPVVRAAPAALVAPIAQSAPQAQTVGNGLAVTLHQSVSQEPLLGGSIGYTLAVSNTGVTPVVDRGYNLTISDTLPSGLTYVSATPAPTLVSPQANGTTLLMWDNIADL